MVAVGFASSEIERLSASCAGTEFLQANSISQIRELLRGPVQPKIDLLLVSTKDKDEREAHDEFVQLRDSDALKDVPLLAAITRYQMDLGQDVRRIQGSDFIIQPIDGDQFVDKIRGLGLGPSRESASE